ncbi:MAG: o-succinylbenzoate synthase [Symploca sp. SIO2E6]|nr:o-succinylbenzoate synthase [Symploca sp. SIO2E6]
MLYKFDFRPYRRPFVRPLATSHGNWEVREGIILRLTDETGKTGWGEIAPISWFGSETLEQALDFCQQLPPQITTTDIFSIPAILPACQFGFESAWEWYGRQEAEPTPNPSQEGNRRQNPPLTPPRRETGGRRQEGRVKPCRDVACNVSTGWDLTGVSMPDLVLPDFCKKFSYLLPAGKSALSAWQTPWQQGYRTFKWKIGVTAMATELKLFNQLLQELPPSAQLRLDANGGLSEPIAHQWLKAAEEVGIVEFVEQPLPPEQFDLMLKMAHQYKTPLALDESVATLNQLEVAYQGGWRGIFVIKPAIAGSPQRLRELCQVYQLDTVFSSALATAISTQAALQLAAELSNPQRAVGFGVNHWFTEDEETWLEKLWNNH